MQARQRFSARLHTIGPAVDDGVVRVGGVEVVYLTLLVVAFLVIAAGSVYLVLRLLAEPK